MAGTCNDVHDCALRRLHVGVGVNVDGVVGC